MSELPDPELHVRVRKARKAQNKRQQDVADEADISLRAYQMFETGNAKPQPANLRAILRAVKMDEAQDQTQTLLTWETWDSDIQQYLQWLGVYLDSLDDDARRAFMGTLALQIIQSGKDSV